MAEEAELFDAGRAKRCPRCCILRPIDEFTIRRTGRVGHPVAHCKRCRVESVKASKDNDPSIYRRIEWPSKLKRLHGLTVEDYYKILEQQGGGCAICGSLRPGNTRLSVFNVDHCHSTGRIRGLLCHNCNMALGLIGDSPETARKIIAYLGKGDPQ